MSGPGFYDTWDAKKRAKNTTEGAQDGAQTNGRPVDPVTDAGYAHTALSRECHNVTAAANGTRNHTLNRAAFNLGQLVSAGALAETEVRDRLTDAARGAGLDESEIAPTIGSGLGSGAQHPRHIPERPEPPTPTVLEPSPEQADEFWAARELLTHLHTFARARRVSPWAVLGVTLARVVTAVPYHVVLPALVGGHASLNTFVGLVGRSGAGKGAAEAVATEALDVGVLTTHTTGSGEGIAHGYVHREKGEVVQHATAVLFSVPEIDTLTALGSRQGATLMPELRRGWSGEALGFAYADPTKRLPVPAHRYRMCLVAGVQPGRARALLDDTDAGTPQRFLWLPAVDTDAPDEAPECPATWRWSEPDTRPVTVGMFTTRGGKVVMGVCATATETIDRARLDRLRGDGDALDGHVLLARLKVAAALACAEGRLNVDDEDWQLAGVVADKSEATRAGVADALRSQAKTVNTARAEAEAERAVTVNERVEDAAVQRVCSVVLRRLRRTGEWMARHELRKSCTSRDRAYVEIALDRLIETGQVVEDDVEGHGGGLRFKVAEEG